jgi:K+-sensing histidine kinase KdpD
VALAAYSRGRRLVLEVSDEGDGIPEKDLPYVFDRFYRARSADGTRGSGLGLAIVKGIAEAHGGVVDVKSEVGVGTTFRVELPRFERGRSGTEGRRPPRRSARPGLDPDDLVGRDVGEPGAAAVRIADRQ